MTRPAITLPRADPVDSSRLPRTAIRMLAASRTVAYAFGPMRLNVVVGVPSFTWIQGTLSSFTWRRGALRGTASGKFFEVLRAIAFCIRAHSAKRKGGFQFRVKWPHAAGRVIQAARAHVARAGVARLGPAAAGESHLWCRCRQQRRRWPAFVGGSSSRSWRCGRQRCSGPAASRLGSVRAWRGKPGCARLCRRAGESSQRNGTEIAAAAGPAANTAANTTVGVASGW
jgi:hypothetical protein